MTTGAPQQQITELLDQAAAGDGAAAGAILPLVYEELRRLAARQMDGERAGQTLQPTALVHEAYLRLVGSGNSEGAGDLRWRSRGHFYGAAAIAMRRIMVERARRRAAIKHGGAHQRVDWDVEAVGGLSTPEEVLSLDEALSVLAARDPRKAEIVHLRFFAGLSIEQTAAALDLSPTTVKEEWSYARAWLRREIRRLGAAPGQGES